jgi:hypothetical protein
MPEFDALTVGEAQSHVVVEDCVHVLDPKRVDRPVENYPRLVILELLRRLSHDLRAQPVVPFLRDRVYLAVKLSH